MRRFFAAYHDYCRQKSVGFAFEDENLNRTTKLLGGLGSTLSNCHGVILNVELLKKAVLSKELVKNTALFPKRC